MNTNTDNKEYDVIIIGGGASGMMAGTIASMRGKKVLLLEKNKKLGKKLSISGGGRCNITNDEDNIRIFLAKYGESADFLYSAFSKFNKNDTFKFFELLGLPLVVQGLKRAFPKTERASDVVGVLEKMMQKNKVEIRMGVTVEKIESEKDLVTEVVTSAGIFKGKNIILATGGVSHKETGSTGDGFKWLKDLGHTVKDPTPTIVPIKVPEKWVHTLSGITLDDMKLTIYLDDVKKITKSGRLLFTHFGLSGPLILNTAGEIGYLLEAGIVTGKIDCYPKLNISELEAKIIGVFDENKNKMLKNILREVVPTGIAPGIEVLLKDKIDFEKKVHSITKSERRLLADTLKSLPLTITSLMGYDKAVVADGGVPLSEIDTKTMRSNKYKNLFITGDLLHVNRPTGGYSLQLCWTSGYLAGENI